MIDRPRRKGFTLLELLIVIVIILVLASLLMSAITAARRKALVSVCSTQIKAIESALEAYNADMGYYPGARDTGAGTYDDMAAYVYAGLVNKPTPAAGGGMNSPYLTLKDNQRGYISGDCVDWLYSSTNAAEDILMPTAVTLKQVGGVWQPFDPQTEANQAAHGPVAIALKSTGNGAKTTGEPLVILDPWGNYIHYREFASKTEKQKTDDEASPHNVAHNRSKVDIWSNGPDHMNDFGRTGVDDASNRQYDDINNWSG